MRPDTKKNQFSVLSVLVHVNGTVVLVLDYQRWHSAGVTLVVTKKKSISVSRRPVGSCGMAYWGCYTGEGRAGSWTDLLQWIKPTVTLKPILPSFINVSYRNSN